MTVWVRRIPGQFPLGILALVPILIVMVLLAVFPPDGIEREAWAQFIGRFHPLAVHFPIALTLLVPIFGVLSGIIVLGEHLTRLMLLGAALTLAGVAIVVLRRPRVIAPVTKAGASV